MVLLDAPPGWRRALGAALVFGVSGAFYEASWGAPLLLAAALVLGAEANGERRADRVRDLSCLLAAQLGLIAYNRWTAGFGGAVTKTIHSDMLRRLGWNLRDLRRLTEHFSPLAPLAFVAVAAAALPSWGPARRAARRVLTLGGLAAAGVVVSSVLLAAAGYGVSAQGLDSRTLLADNLWIALSLGGLGALRRPGRWVMGWAMVAAAVLAQAQARNMRDWRTSWQSQERVLAAFPWDAFERLLPGSLVAADLPAEPGQVPDFSEPWDLSSAVRACAPPGTVAAAGEAKGKIVTVLRRWDCVARWDGSTFEQDYKGGPLQARYAAAHAYEWIYPARRFRPLFKGWTSDVRQGSAREGR